MLAGAEKERPPGQRVALGEDDTVQQPIPALEPHHRILAHLDSRLAQLLFLLL